MYISGHGMAMKNDCTLVMICGRNDMDDEMAGVDLEWSLLSTWFSCQQHDYCSEHAQCSRLCQFVDEMIQYGGRNGLGGT